VIVTGLESQIAELRTENEGLQSDAEAATIVASERVEAQVALVGGLESQIEELRSDAEAGSTASTEAVESLEAQVVLVAGLEAQIEELRTENEELESDAEAATIVASERVEAQVALVGGLESQIEELRSDAEAGSTASTEAVESLEAQVVLVGELESQIEELRSDAEAGSTASTEAVESQVAVVGEPEDAEGEASDQSAEIEETVQADVALLEIEPAESTSDVMDPSPEALIEPTPLAGISLRDRIDNAENSEASSSEDSLDAIRNEAMSALEEARALKDRPVAETVDEVQVSEDESAQPAKVVLDYSPSVPAPERVSDVDENQNGEMEESDPVESRYARNSAKLPRLGIEPGAASNTIANLRKQMTADQ